MLIAINIINVKTKGKLESILQIGGKWKQYFVASLLGAAPGCLGFLVGVSLYFSVKLLFLLASFWFIYFNAFKRLNIIEKLSPDILKVEKYDTIYKNWINYMDFFKDDNF
jgi:hypothetical protein